MRSASTGLRCCHAWGHGYSPFSCHHAVCPRRRGRSPPPRDQRRRRRRRRRSPPQVPLQLQEGGSPMRRAHAVAPSTRGSPQGRRRVRGDAARPKRVAMLGVRTRLGPCRHSCIKMEGSRRSQAAPARVPMLFKRTRLGPCRHIQKGACGGACGGTFREHSCPCSAAHLCDPHDS